MAFIVGMVLLMAATLFNTFAAYMVAVVCFAVHAAYVYWQYRVKIRAAKTQLSHFADDNNFVFVESNEDISESGTLYKHGYDRRERYILSGVFSDLPARISNYEYSTGSGRSRQDHTVRVMRLELPNKLPHMVIDCLIESDTAVSTLPITFNASQKLELEGDFYKYFNLYAPDKFAVSALALIAPDAMDALMRMKSLCDIEIIDRYIYFYWPKFEITQQNYQNNFETAAVVMEEIQKKLVNGSLSKDLTIAKEVSSKSAPGVRLKPAGIKASYVIGGVVIIGFYISSFFLTDVGLKDIFAVLFFLYIIWMCVSALRDQRQVEQNRQLYDRYR